MGKLFLSILLVTIMLLGKSEVFAQTSSPTKMLCQQSAKEILSEIETVYGLSPVSDKVLVVGEVKMSLLLANERNLFLTQALAVAGGVLSTAANHSVYLLRQANEGETQTVLEIDLREIKMGRIKDILLENGDLVFIPKHCPNGKKIPFTDAPVKSLQLIDSQISFLKTSFSQEHLLRW